MPEEESRERVDFGKSKSEPSERTRGWGLEGYADSAESRRPLFVGGKNKSGGIGVLLASQISLL
jgi:hypothetical protein